MTGQEALLSNSCVSFGFIRRWSRIARVWQTIVANFLSIKSYQVAQTSTNIIVLILLFSIY